MNRAPSRFSTVSSRSSQEHQTDQSVFGNWQGHDAIPQSSLDAEEEFRRVQPGVKISRLPFSGALPLATTPRQPHAPTFRMVPTSTRSVDIHTEFADMSEARGPLYLQQWPIWDNLPFLPSRGDVSLDPRYAMQTKGSSATYMKVD